MSVTSGFFNSVNGDRKYNAEQINEFFGGLISSGVLPGQLQVTAKDGMTISVAEGKGFIDSHWVKNDSPYDLTLANADSVLDRIDAIIMKLDLTTEMRNITIRIKRGNLMSNPTPPEMTRTSTVKEYCLATIRVKKGATSITQADITDTRADNNVCGWVTGLITQVDTADLFIQFQDAYEQQLRLMDEWFEHQQQLFDDWFNSLTETLGVNTYVKRYRKVYELTESANTLSLDLSNYSYENSDTVLIFVNGVKLYDAYDYLINFNVTPARIDFANAMDPGNIVEVTILKSEIALS